MPKTGGDITRKRILEQAEKLFSEKGFDGAGIEEIANNAGINKATIYYHFKSKKDIIEALLNSIIIDLNSHLESYTDSHNNDDTEENLINKISREIKFIESKKKIISIMMMESLKSGSANNFLFKCADLIINNELKEHGKLKLKENQFKKDKQKFFVYEFFTGFIPFITFIIFKEGFSDYFDFDEDTVFKHFLESFKKSHLSSH